MPTDDEVVTLFPQWRDRGGPQPEAAIHADPGADPPRPETPDLEARSFTREVDTTWKRSSYSSLSKTEVVAGPAGCGPGGGQRARGHRQGRRDASTRRPSWAPGRADGAAPDVPSPMADLPVGATFGSLVHAVLEHTDPDAPDLRAELLGHIDEQLGWWPVDLDREVLADSLVAVCDSPLGPLVGRDAARDPADRPAAGDGVRAAAVRGRRTR